ncbi:cation diffusion facilitator family transporter [Streptomyces pseudogriseolus]|uniref:Cation efflux system protein n=1 Tax=Streptomyces pseudogriseolus TaxID=36817 RepID=A0ABQ2T042_STREZ|nr:cation diffusion facilitator family transporter [Streptomyces rubiginosus]GGS46534.1 cation efflux system protein [Streptomyces rubiginosus]
MDGKRHAHHDHDRPARTEPTRRLKRLRRLRHRLVHLLTPHSHDTGDRVDAAMETSREGMRTLWISLVVLGITALVQAVIVALSGSMALLGDTVHNAADALTAVPLGIAFLLGRRAANRRYTYGYGRAEDLAGVLIVVTIAASAVLAAWTAVDRLLHPREVTHLWAVSGAALAGFVGNEWVARYRIRTGRRIGSAALVADGLHARTDGFTSLAVLLGAGGTALGLRAADPVVGLLITLAILMVLKDAAREVYRRLMDSVDPDLVATAHATLRGVDGVLGTGQVRMRWIGHALRAEADIVVDARLTVVEAHRIAVAAEHALLHAVPRLSAATVHTDHTPVGGDPHATLHHHAPESVRAAVSVSPSRQ